MSGVRNLKRRIYADIENRAKEIYEQYKCLMRPKQIESILNFSFYESLEINGKSWYEEESNKIIDHLQISYSVVDHFF